MTRAGILTKYKPRIHATRNGKSLRSVGEILRGVSRVWEVVKIRSKYENRWERIEGVRESKNRGPQESGS